MPFMANKVVERIGGGGRKRIPTDILVAASLRHLGKGTDFRDAIAGATHVSKDTLLNFHHAFMEELGDPGTTVSCTD